MRHQKGASYIAIMFAIMGFAFMAKVAIAVWGPYFDDRIVSGEIEDLLKQSANNTDPNKFLQQLQQRLDMNNVRDFDTKNNIAVENAGGLKVKSNYEIRKNFVMNIDLVMKFEKDFDQSTVKAK